MDEDSEDVATKTSERTLREIFDGAAADSSSDSATSERTGWKKALAEDERFQKFVAKISSSGFFQSHQAGSKEYEELLDRAMAKYTSHFQKAADELKTAGNELMKKKKYEEALACYTKAIAKCGKGPNSYQYYGNSAAARLNLKDYKGAEEDCEKGIALNPDYAKLYKRLGTAREMQKNYKGARESYERAMALDPDHELTYATSVERVRSRETAALKQAEVSTSTAPTLPGGMNGGGGLGGLMGMMNNPEVMKMAQNMMKDPKMMQMAQNMMSNMGGPSTMTKLMEGMAQQQKPSNSDVSSTTSTAAPSL